MAILDEFSQLLPSVIANLPHAVLVAGRNGDVYFCNDVAARVFGYELKELESMSLERLFPDRYQPLEQVKDVFASDQPGSRQKRIAGLRKDGTEFPAEVSLSRLEMEGKPSLTMVLVNDFAGRIPDQKSIDRFLETAAASSEAIAALDLIENQVVVLDRQWQCVFVNQATLANLKKSREELIGQRYWDLYPGVVGSDVDQAVRSAFDHGQRTSLEYHYAKYGRWYRIEIFPSATSLTVHAIDITLSRQSKLINERLLHTLDALNDPIMIISQQWINTFSNQAACRFMHKKREDMEGQNVWDLFPKVPGKSFETACRAAMESDVPTRLVYNSQVRDRWFDNRFFPTPDGIIVHTLDITEYKRSSKRLADTMAKDNTEQDLQQAFGIMPDPVIMLDREGRITFINEPGLRPNSRRLEAVVGRIMWDINPGLKKSQLYERVSRALSTGERQQFEFSLPPAGKWFHIELIPWNDRIIIYSVDIQKQKEGEESVAILTKTLEKILEGDDSNPRPQ